VINLSYLGFRAAALYPRLYAAARIRGLSTRQNVGEDKVLNPPLHLKVKDSSAFNLIEIKPS
jgi:hypothetical protein